MDGEKIDRALHVVTPLIESYQLSKEAGFTVHLKLDNTQPTHTFKIRGIGNLIQQEIKKGCKRLVASSGGNAGLAAAYSARKLGIPITIYVPQSTPQFMVERLRGEGATVTVHGSVWDHANQRALEDAKDPECANIHPFDHPDIWEGHSSMMVECKEQLNGIKPDLVILSVGGGGLLCGAIKGMEKVGWKDVPLLGMETIGADCLNVAVKNDKITTLPDITSVAKCLGALTVAEQCFQYYKEGRVISDVITDAECIEAISKFTDDQKMLVEPACGAALGAIYCGVVKKLQKEGKLGNIKNALLVVCGGTMVTMETMNNWKIQFKVK